MIQLPEEHELLWLFETEPELFEPDEPWCFNILTFSVARGPDELRCIITPYYGDLQIHWKQTSHKILDLSLSYVERLQVQKENGRELMVAEFDPSINFKPLELQLKPSVYLSWGSRSDNRDSREREGSK
jgi:hypothetical protein